MKNLRLATIRQNRPHGWRWMRWGLCLLVLAAVLGASPATAQQWDRTAVKQALQATVQILVPDDNGDLFDIGSGTVLDAERGIILTNYHVMGDTEKRELYNKDGVAVIAVTPADLKGAPVMKYIAKMIDGSPDDDLAVLRITAMIDDPQAPLPKNLGLVAVDRGNSEDLLPGDPLAVIGFPGLGGSTVTFTNGVVSGFLDENEDGVYEWIKTDTEVNPGNSGGLAIDQKGDFVGVPTLNLLPNQPGETGKISLVRPGAIALEFLDHAVLGQGGGQNAINNGKGAKATTLGQNSGSAVSGSFGPITFAPDIDSNDQPIDAGNTFVEVDKVYAFFSVTGIEDGGAWQTRWLLDGEEVLKENQVWQGGDVSSTWVNISHPDGLPVGKFTLELYQGGKLAQRGDFTVAARAKSSGGPKPVNVEGVVHDADNTRKTISGALIVFLQPGVTIRAWDDAKFDESMVQATGTSARGGKFQLDNKVMPGESYSVVVVQDGYKPIQVDAYKIPVDTGDPYELDVAMERN